ncbi:amidase [Rudaeicoccus suwonensis]|uniref:Amidase/aspartyl-tRNA(Asn)/glutamyl-tRNA(Gln) amidotransferase subunit A n=1 Tax=Rudaeicoccus suwonensis TaxID=657409 RepID=A0A561EA02_9MICO|nr:amidase [Rudaeicoccus suwonensis]TWE12453.1 amidase/aspartyl-tRNA(Asn)/glutamyl-tRNA(Gln) amidotransferase subunit A [Rudaeicoccus suwonensis]
MIDVPMIDVAGLGADIRAGRASSVAAVAAAYDRLDSLDPRINAITDRYDDAALAAARAVDDAVASGVELGPLAGVPITVKDHVWLAGTRSTNGSRALADFVPERSAVCVQRLLDAGAVVIAKTNNPEFCYRGTTSNEVFGMTTNPHDVSRTAGGSSGGAAATVASGVVGLAVGTDGGGSIRIPSAFCGTYGLKPTYGAIPTRPGFRGWPSLSVHGPIAGSLRGLQIALAVMAGATNGDPAAGAHLATTDRKPLRELRIGASLDLGFAAVDDSVAERFEQVLHDLRAAGLHINSVAATLPDPCPIWDSIALPEGHASEGPLLERSPQLVGDDAKAIIAAGAVDSRTYLDAQERRGEFATQWLRLLDNVDLLLTPTMPLTAFDANLLGPTSLGGRPVSASFDAWCALALPANLAGTPALSIPVGTDEDGLPIGLQIQARRGADHTLLHTATSVQDLIGR